MRARRMAGLFLVAVVSLAFAFAATATVKIVGDPTPDYVQITNAIRFAIAGDVILVSTGTYVEVFNIMSKSLTIDGRYDTGCVFKVAGTTELMLPGPYLPPVVWIEDSDALLIDLDITGGIPGGGTVTRGGGVYLAAKSDVRMEGCRVYNNQANGYGGGIYVTNSSLTLTNCLVFSNSSVKALSGTWLPEGRGGGIAVVNGYLEVFGSGAGGTDNSIKWNSAEHMGGGIYLDDRSWAILSNETSDVLFNTATNGGGIAVIGASRVDILAGADVCSNSAVHSGGGVYLMNSTGRMRGASTFIGNNAIALGPNVAGTYGGGVAAVHSTFEIQINGSVAHNRSQFAGGGVYLSNAVCVVDGGDIGYRYNFVHTNIASQLGGGVFLHHGSRLVLTNDAVVHGNRTGISAAGGIYANNNAAVILDDSAVRYNTAGGFGGGGIYANSSSITGRNSRIHDNRVYGASGGGLRAYQCDAFFNACDFTNNIAEVDGGGISWAGGGSYTLTLTNETLLARNTAGRNGGGIYLDAPAQMHKARIRFNTASNDGGGICISNTFANLSSVDLEYNEADADGDGVGNGGAIWVGYSGKFDAASRHRYTVMDRNQAVNGGGIFVAPNSTGTVGRGAHTYRFFENEAVWDGGGIAVSGGVVSVTGNVLLVNSIARYDGGGIYAFQSLVNLHGGVLVGDADPNNGSVAGNFGGGMALDQSTLFASDVTFQNNIATNYSGGLDTLNSFVFGTNIVFSGNEARLWDGGAMYAQNSDAILSNVIATNNVATRRGGGFVWDGANISLTGGQVGDNEASEAGGLNLSGCNAYLDSVLFSANRATAGGGAIRMVNSATLRGTNLFIAGNTADSDMSGDGNGGALTIRDNSAAWLYGTNGTTLIINNHGYYGGGIHVTNGFLSMEGKSWIEGNTATNGAGLYLSVATAQVERAYILRNAAGLHGGGVYVATNAHIQLLNCLLAGNLIPMAGFGGGLRLSGGSANVAGCTVYSNLVGGVECSFGSSLEIAGCIVYGHSLVNITLGYTVNYSDVEYGYIGVNNFDAEPLLNPANYHLTVDSPCRDAGWLVMGGGDVDSEVRVGNFDVGFDEFIDGDGDDLPDVIETDTGVWVNEGDTGSDPTDTDSDDDGVSDGEEWMADTDPNNDQAFLQFTAIYSHAPGGCTVRWMGGTNAVQYLEIARDFTTTNNPNWQIYSTRTPPTASPGSDAMILWTNVGLRIRARRF